MFLNLGAEWRPTEKLRVDSRYQLQSYQRRTDGSVVGIRRIPSVKVEYQVARPVFVRFVGQYDGQWTDDLRDDSRTNLPIYIRNASGVYRRAGKTYDRSFQADWLFSYQPTPGTVVFAGYGNSLANREASPVETRLRPRARRVFSQGEPPAPTMSLMMTNRGHRSTTRSFTVVMSLTAARLKKP
ncbi:MAG: hypothetical protein ACT4QD_12800 [Acidobacteriota bacterium]